MVNSETAEGEAPLDFPTYIDSSMLSIKRDCARKHYWSTLRQLYPMGKSVHLIAGGAFAAGIEAARRHCFTAAVPHLVTVDEMLTAALPPFARAWGDYVPEPKSSKTFENTFNALAHYVANYHPAHDEVQPYIRPDGTPAVEYKFAVPLQDLRHPITNEPLFFAGRFDMIGLLNGIPCVVDEKTTGSLGFDWATKWDMRGQFIGYIWALRQQGFSISYACVNGIAILKTKNEVQRAIVRYPDHLIDRWYKQLYIDVNHMLEAWRYYHQFGRDLTTAYPMNFANACESYGGCAFTTLCTAGNPEPFTTNYIRHRYNPLEAQPVEEKPLA